MKDLEAHHEREGMYAIEEEAIKKTHPVCFTYSKKTGETWGEKGRHREKETLAITRCT